VRSDSTFEFSHQPRQHLAPRITGEIPGVPRGTAFQSRAELSAAGVHTPPQAGISGSREEGANSIVLSGGYEDDVDEGTWIVYTGQGGNDRASGKQVADQELVRGNLGLARSADEGLPVRVIRGAGHRSKYSPQSGFRYDGLFYVEKYWHDKGQSGFLVWRFLLRDAELSAGVYPDLERPILVVADRKLSTIQRIVRNTAVATEVKKLYDYRCQVCVTRLSTQSGPYAEGAHIRPLGRPHDGPDSKDNILCLCPNHHVLFDRGAFAIDDTLKLIGIDGRLETTRGHEISRHHLDYHRKHYATIRTA
jgi:putative restriction endonuclease